MKTISNRIKYAYIIVLALIMTACHEKKAPEIETTVDTVIKVDEENDEYEYDEVKDTTSAQVAAWLQTVSMDSIERLLCRHDGKVVTPDGQKLHVFITDVLSCLPEKAMDYPFKEAVKRLDIIDHRSPDGRVRIITWNTGMGGSCPDNARYTLFKDNNGRIHSQGSNHYEAVVLDIQQLQDNKNNTLYLTFDYFLESGCMGAAWVTAWYIQGDSLAKAPVFPNEECEVGLESPILGGYYPVQKYEYWSTIYELVGRNLYIIIDEIDHSINDRYNLYRWKGDHFDLMGEVGNRHLHTSLRNYVSLEGNYVTKDYRVRIDRMEDNTYRYASWRRNKQTDDLPDLIITNGKYDKKKGCYLFENDGYYYRVTTTEEENHLIVEKDGRTVLRQNIE